MREDQMRRSELSSNNLFNRLEWLSTHFPSQCYLHHLFFLHHFYSTLNPRTCSLDVNTIVWTEILRHIGKLQIVLSFSKISRAIRITSGDISSNTAAAMKIHHCERNSVVIHLKKILQTIIRGIWRITTTNQSFQHLRARIGWGRSIKGAL